ncbi:hypothetical protein SDC9_43841 [bioreactor metagenome]|uniref:site-specific DNA-methyltransferase (adenine-specific) n=1 Tax=bioreactor metagenome TaxID=1076179 RepID=A0A644W1P6_9ZZZZ
MLNLNAPYSRTEFIGFLENNFLPEDFRLVEEKLSVDDFKTQFCKDVYKLGCSKKLGLDVYEITHTSSHDARVGISKDAFQILLRKSYNNRALVLFVPEGSKQYRFSLIQIEAEVNDQTARIKRSYSNPRRYSFLLGENAHVKTPEQYLLQKGKLKPKDGDYFKDLQERFSVEVLTKEFYRELSNWYFWAVKKVAFPNDVNDDTDNEKYNTENIIRLITRLIFVWFIKQKELVSPDLFNPEVLKTLLKDFEPESPVQHHYYRAILQNLFFATLNQEIGKRGFAGNKGFLKNRGTYNIKNLYRYEDEFQCDTSKVLQLFSEVPFLNGGLFECLDDKVKDGKILYWDGFSRKTSRQAIVPNELFFAQERIVDISKEYNDKKMQSVKVSGIIEILKKYNFTVEENTPVEIEVALDPELLGKVFENLLGAYNPETQETARKQTGSFYTPREIVNYMVNESLIAYYQTKVPDVSEENLRALFSYEDKLFDIPGAKREALIQATFDCKILDPACGSGAFPMGILQQMVHVLGKLDPQNTFWSRLVLDKSMQEFDDAEKETDEDKLVLQEEIYNTFETHIQFPDYTRKLYLIENCIYGVDIQSIAVQISKLRFFISLICEQKRNSNPEMNYGIRPLPNLETKFVAANTLIGIEKPEEDVQYLKEDQINHMIKRLNHLRHRQFSVTNASKKKELRRKDETLRHDIVNEVARLYKLHADENLNRYKMQLKLAERELDMLEQSPDDIRTTTSTDLFGNEKTDSYNYTEKRRKELKQQIKMLNNSIEAGSNYSRLNSIVRLAEQLTSWNPYDQNVSSSFFDPEWMFGLKPDENGEGYFDVVIGNPPWGAKLSLEDKTHFKNVFREIDSSTPNTFSYFIGWAFKNYNCVISFVLPDSILIKDYAKTRTLIKDFVSEIVWYENSGVPDEYKPFVFVDHDVCVINISKRSSLRFRRTLNKFDKITKKFIVQVDYPLKSMIFLKEFEYAFNLIAEEKDFIILNKILRFEPLDVYMQCHEGIHTGNSRELLFFKERKNDFCKPLFYGASVGDKIQNYKSNSSGWFVDYRSEIIKKTEGNYASLRDERIFKHPKLYITRTGNPFKVFYDENTYSSNNFFSLQHKDYSKNSSQFLKYLLPFLVSKLAQFFIRTFAAPRIGSTFIETKIFHLLKFRIPITNESISNVIINRVDLIISKKEIDSEFDSSLIELELLVYRLYDLTYSEVKVIDPEIESKISEEEYEKIKVE